MSIEENKKELTEFVNTMRKRTEMQKKIDKVKIFVPIYEAILKCRKEYNKRFPENKQPKTQRKRLNLKKPKLSLKMSLGLILALVIVVSVVAIPLLQKEIQQTAIISTNADLVLYEDLACTLEFPPSYDWGEFEVSSGDLTKETLIYLKNEGKRL